jgi:hypothetical protein
MDLQKQKPLRSCVNIIQMPGSTETPNRIDLKKDGMIMNKTKRNEMLKTELSSKLRREEDGGKTVKTTSLIPGRHFIRPMKINVEKFLTPFQWNEKYIIEPFQSGAETGFAREHTPNKK